MAGVILETLSTRKLIAFGVILLLLQIIFFLVGGLVAPAPYYAQHNGATVCFDPDGADKSQFFVPHGPSEERNCNKRDIKDLWSLDTDHLSSKVVFAIKMPLPRDNMYLDHSRWFQNVIGILIPEVSYKEGAEISDDSVITLDARLAYRNKWDPPQNWTEIIRSTEERNIKCEIEKREDDSEMHCDPMPLFELGSSHHDYYLLNIRVPVDEKKGINTQVGFLKGFKSVIIIQTGGFTMVWFSIKTFFFPIVLLLLVFYARRVREQVRPTNLLEKTLFSLGCAMTLLNLPVEWLTLWVYMPDRKSVV